MKRKDAMSPKPVKGQEAARGGEPKSSGQRWSSCQAAVRPAIIDVEELAREVEGSEVQGKFLQQHPKMASQALHLRA